MRWDDLFADLEGQLSAASAAQFNAEVSELTRGERAAVELSARIKASVGDRLRVMLRDGDYIDGDVKDASAQWLLVRSDRHHHVIPLGAVATMSGLSVRAVPMTEVEQRLTMGHAMRALSRDRARVVVHTDGGECTGVIGAVGADHMDVATSVGSRSRVTVPFAALVQVRSAEG